MSKSGKQSILGVLIDIVDYKTATDQILCAAHQRTPFAVSALAVHGTMTAVLDPEQRYRLNSYELLVPDGQPIRWALNWLHGAGLKDRVYGPKLTLEVLSRAAEEQVPIYLYGSTSEVLEKFCQAISQRFPDLRIAGAEPSRFRRLTSSERESLIDRVRSSGAGILLAGLGCPRQEVFAYEMRHAVEMPVLAIGAAFPFIAGTLAQAPRWIQAAGLEWLFRLLHEPRRLWKRYVYLNPAYVLLVMLQRLRIGFDREGSCPKEEVLVG
jgi:N-acetylglucosaminyldiphosphoundecaprenol N-acetyl-beta-D-mannosaminyltransferase